MTEIPQGRESETESSLITKLLYWYLSPVHSHLSKRGGGLNLRDIGKQLEPDIIYL